MTDAASPGWYADPSGRHETRYWDGSRWTEHVTDAGRQGTDPPPSAPDAEKVRRQVRERAGIGEPVTGGTGHLLDEPVLVVNQKAKLVELTNEYAVYDQGGAPLGSVVQVGQSGLRKALRLVSSVDQFLSVRYEVRDRSGTPVLHLHRPAKFMKSRVVVSDARGVEVGSIVQQNVFGKIRFDLTHHGRRIGGINAENWRAWNFSVVDEAGAELARITKTWEGVAKTMFTTADNYVVQIHSRLSDPLRSLVVASALTVDTALKQDARGIG